MSTNIIHERGDMSSLHFHREIDFDVLELTPEAFFVKIKKVKSSKFNRFANLKSTQKVIQPLEMWVPRSWFRKKRWVSYVGCPGNMEQWETSYWVWEEGFLKNIKKLCEERKATAEGVDKNFF